MVATSRQPSTDGLSALFDVFVLAQAVHELLVDAFAGAPLTPEEYALYRQLLRTPGSSPSALAHELAAPLTTVSDWVRTLMQRGHGVRQARPEDRRSYGIVLTAAGQRGHRETNRRFEHANATFLAAFGRPERELRAVLTEATLAATTARARLAAEARDPAS